MKRCCKCQSEIKPEDLYCGFCGANLLSRHDTMGTTQKELKLDDIQLSLGMVYIKKGDYLKAVETLKKILDRNPANERALQLLKQAEAEIDCVN